MHSTPRIKFNMSLFPSFLNIYFFSVWVFFFGSLLYRTAKMFTFWHFYTIQIYKLFPPTMQLPPLTCNHLKNILYIIYYV